jgi:hypothetical protein
MDPSTKLIKNDNLVFRIVKEDGIIYDPGTKREHVLNKMALLAWGLWDGRHSLQDVAKTVAIKCEADLEQVMQDISNHADELCKHGVLSDAA